MSSTVKQLAGKFVLRFLTGMIIWAGMNALMTANTRQVQVCVIGLACAVVAHLNFRTARNTDPTPEGR